MGQRDGQEGPLGRRRSAVARPSVKASVNPTQSPEAGMPFRSFPNWYREPKPSSLPPIIGYRLQVTQEGRVGRTTLFSGGQYKVGWPPGQSRERVRAAQPISAMWGSGPSR